mmetsp:Transcript_57597/g.150051  ORF Transcript_57597/g.150051 Transcript_57597/m.150051 type:complete len:80 (+) Transcript_57597:3-242(+)
MSMYLAVLMDKVWNCKDLPLSQKLAIMLQLDDDDLQQLVIEEKDKQKGAIAASVRKWIHANALEGSHLIRDSMAAWVIR